MIVFGEGLLSGSIGEWSAVVRSCYSYVKEFNNNSRNTLWSWFRCEFYNQNHKLGKIKVILIEIFKYHIKLSDKVYLLEPKLILRVFFFSLRNRSYCEIYLDLVIFKVFLTCCLYHVNFSEFCSTGTYCFVYQIISHPLSPLITSILVLKVSVHSVYLVSQHLLKNKLNFFCFE